MNKLLPIEYKDNIFKRIMNKIKKVFFKKKNIDNYLINECSEIKNKKNTLENLKVQIKIDNKKFEQEKFLKQLSNKPELLENFTTEKLEIILNYVLKENKKKQDFLKQLESN